MTKIFKSSPSLPFLIFLFLFQLLYPSAYLYSNDHNQDAVTIAGSIEEKIHEVGRPPSGACQTSSLESLCPKASHPHTKPFDFDALKKHIQTKFKRKTKSPLHPSQTGDISIEEIIGKLPFESLSIQSLKLLRNYFYDGTHLKELDPAQADMLKLINHHLGIKMVDEAFKTVATTKKIYILTRAVNKSAYSLLATGSTTKGTDIHERSCIALGICDGRIPYYQLFNKTHLSSKGTFRLKKILLAGCKIHVGDRLFDESDKDRLPITNAQGHVLTFSPRSPTSGGISSFAELKDAIEDLQRQVQGNPLFLDQATNALKEKMDQFEFRYVPSDQIPPGGLVVQGMAKPIGEDPVTGQRVLALLTTDVDILAIAPLISSVYPQGLVRRSRSLPTKLTRQTTSRPSSAPYLTLQRQTSFRDYAVIESKGDEWGTGTAFDFRMAAAINKIFKSYGPDHLGGPQFELQDIVRHGVEIRYKPSDPRLENSLISSMPIRVYSPRKEDAPFDVDTIEALQSAYFLILSENHMICPRAAWGWHTQSLNLWCPFTPHRSQSFLSRLTTTHPDLDSYLQTCGLTPDVSQDPSQTPPLQRSRSRTPKPLTSSPPPPDS